MFYGYVNFITCKDISIIKLSMLLGQERNQSVSSSTADGEVEGDEDADITDSVPHGQAEDTQTDQERQAWIPHLSLTQGHRKRITMEMIDSDVIDACKEMLRQLFPIEDMDTTAETIVAGMTATATQSVEIHYVRERMHWVTSSTTRLRVEVADSLLSDDCLTPSLRDQLLQRYSSVAVDGELQINILPVMQQTNGIDCGVYAIANAVEFLTPGGNPQSVYDVSKMRHHLLQCLEDGILSPFPKKSRPGRRGRAATTRVVSLRV